MNEKKKKYRFNLVDVILVLLILASAAAVVYLVFFEGKVTEGETSEQTDVIYTLKAADTDSVFRGKINIGDEVIDKKTGNKVGEVIDVQYTDSTYKTYNAERGEAQNNAYPGKIDISVTVSASGMKDSDGVISVGSFKLAIGSRIVFRTPLFEAECICVSYSETGK